MLQNLEREINAEEELTVEPAAWKHAYAIIRCPGSCELGPHCWQDPYGKKHYKLYRDELLSLVRYVQSGIGVPQHHAQRPQHEHFPQSLATIFAQPMTSILLAVSQFIHARMRYCSSRG